ncbi:MAG TPA: hypothetical protein VER33_12325 [Polyangiaceae bacterium]|nr:hypothetical protein [Polyangiaceae bacterium]
MKLGVGLLLCAALFGAEPALAAAAAEQAAEQQVAAAMQALQRGAYDEAIGGLELLADRGFVHPDASLSRAYAYVERARSHTGVAGDLGRAIAALEEARLLRPSEPKIEAALDAMRAEIELRRSRSGSSPVAQRPSFGRAVVGLVPENVWALLAVFGSTLLTAGLILRRWVQQRGAELAGAVGIVVGFILLVVAGALAGRARHYRVSTEPAVVVVPEARLLNEAGLPLRNPLAEVIPEGALVNVHARHDKRARVELGSVEGWLLRAQLRP